MKQSLIVNSNLYAQSAAGPANVSGGRRYHGRFTNREDFNLTLNFSHELQLGKFTLFDQAVDV